MSIHNHGMTNENEKKKKEANYLMCWQIAKRPLLHRKFNLNMSVRLKDITRKVRGPNSLSILGIRPFDGDYF